MSSIPRLAEPPLGPYAEQLFYARRPLPDISGRAVMPRPNPPPTPGSSSDIRGKEGAHTAPVFNLPPTAFQEPDRASTSSAASSNNGSDSSYRPVSPTSTEIQRKRPSTSVITKDDFALPPPPTRSRKIIQMKPKEIEPTNSSSNQSAAGKSQSTTSQAAGKKKQNNAGSTAAGRKIARKTAHSLIERRRRSKMNEEFGVLKDMIPACKGQEMHKLAILQASIEYLRYLEQCVADLQAQTSPRMQPQRSEFRRTERQEEEDNDEEMEDDNQDAATPGSSTPVTATLGGNHSHSNSIVSLPSLSQITTASTSSPSIFSAGAGGRHYSISSAASQASYSPFFHSNQASPAFGPQLHHVSTAPPFGSAAAFGLGSPALKPLDSSLQSHQLRNIAENATELTQSLPPTKGARTERELDHEATAALLMLNHDRRSWRDGETGRSASTGMSVKDLLSG
ncbi:hypothetical protein TI39_contig287g00002 [Zymoseptoria brevis]|uniref:BHLH domain-containing protein n=1 Tax=Zymoseptoria brevis TaxID=1047168 RepID=A0A0F4GW06_9PEZI|nr:hypothetical protein TI39_contig287g00002 [Zymoseptoria brevis]